jgi:hypothetical protein
MQTGGIYCGGGSIYNIYGGEKGQGLKKYQFYLFKMKKLS